MRTSLRLFLINLIIITLVYAPAMAFLPLAKKVSFVPTPFNEVVEKAIAPHEAHRLILKFRDDASPAERRQVVENYGEPELQRCVGASVVTLQLKENVSTALAELVRMDRVIEWVEPDYFVRSSRQEGSQFAGKAVLSKTANQALLPTANSLTAVIDTGLSGKYPGGWNFLNDSDQCADDNGHGTEMARIVSEVNPSVALMPLKALDANGIGTVSKIAAAIDYATNHHAGVILHSFGKLIEEALKRAEMAGVVVIAAAGNDGVDLAKSPQYPAATKAANLITVAALTKNNELAEYSNYGQGVHVAAPGEGSHDSRGTSMAAARVAGIASLLKAERPWVSAETIKQALMRSARRVSSLKVESGAVDAKAALAEFQTAKPETQNPKPKTTCRTQKSESAVGSAPPKTARAGSRKRGEETVPRRRYAERCGVRSGSDAQ